MIALIASGRPERPDSPTYYTVPWFPSLARHTRPQLPGHVMAYLQELGAICRQRGVDPSTLGRSTKADMLAAIVGPDPIANMIYEGARYIAAELEMFSKEAASCRCT